MGRAWPYLPSGTVNTDCDYRCVEEHKTLLKGSCSIFYDISGLAFKLETSKFLEESGYQIKIEKKKKKIQNLMKGLQVLKKSNPWPEGRNIFHVNEPFALPSIHIPQEGGNPEGTHFQGK